MHGIRIGRTPMVATSMAASLLLYGSAAAQNIAGVINGRTGATMTLRTQDSGNVAVILTPFHRRGRGSGTAQSQEERGGDDRLDPRTPGTSAGFLQRPKSVRG